MNVEEAILQLRACGATLELDGTFIRVKFPMNHRTPPAVETALETLKCHKEEALSLLRGRSVALCMDISRPSAPFNLPLGTRILSYEPRKAPVLIDTASVVVDVEKFIKSELHELEARLYSPVQITGGWGVYSILDRLQQVGLELEIAPSCHGFNRES